MVLLSDDEMKKSLEFIESVFDASSDSEDYDIIEETYEKDKNIQNEGDILIYPKKKLK